MNPENYSFHKKRLLRDFDRALACVNQLLRNRLGEPSADRLLRDARLEYVNLIPQIPFIGRNNPLLVFFWPTTRYLAVYRALQKQGFGIAEAGQLTYLIGTEEIRTLPALTRRVIRHLWFSPWLRARLKKRSRTSHQRHYPGDYVLNYVADDGQAFDFGVDYLECASCKFLAAEEALELAPYVCAIDKPASELLGWGLQRTMTLAEGAPKCDFRFKKGGETRVPIPDTLQGSFWFG